MEKDKIVSHINTDFDYSQELKIDKEGSKKLTGYASIDKPWLKYFKDSNIVAQLEGMKIVDYLYNAVYKNGNRVAIDYLGNKITFNTLFENIDKVSKAFVAMGIKKGDIVTICMPSTPESIYCVYALNTIGAIPNLIDPRTSAIGIKDYINEVNSDFLVTIDLCMKNIESIKKDTNLKKIVSVSAFDSASIGLKFINKIKNISNKKEEYDCLTWDEFIEKGKDVTYYVKSTYEKDAPAAIVHTGGTTGKPKGVVLSDDNINSIVFQYKEGGIKYNDKQSFLDIIPIFAAYGLCVSVHMPLSLGMKTIVIPKFEPKNFSKILMQYKPNHVVGVPTFWEGLTKDKKVQRKDLSFLVTPAMGGDNIKPQIESAINKFFKEHNCTSKLVKGYGMSELSSSACTCVDNCNEISSVGIPLVKTTISIFEPYITGETEDYVDKELKYNEQGEICITGPSMMLKYFNNQKLTDNIIRKHSDGKYWVHTGDLGYMNENGSLYVVDRIKRFIVRYDGFKIYPSGVEKTILNHKDVENCAVVRYNNPEIGPMPKAYLVLKENVIDEERVIKEVEQICLENLALRSVPDKFEVIESLPVTNLGKVDYKALEEQKNINIRKLKK